MWTATVLLFCWTLLLHVSWTWGSAPGLKYRRAGEEARQQSAEAITFQRFTRAESNVTISDSHNYYTSTYYPASNPMAASLWQDLAGMADGEVEVDDFTAESQLSGLHRYYEVHQLKFQFPFYGHTLDRLAVTTGGFLYTGDLLHDQVAVTQFIAPLQADFNPNHTDTGRVLVWSTEERFTVQWDKVHNHDHQDDGPFTFQVSIFPNGVIHFVYLEVPLLLDDIDNEGHPVDVGLSDAFYIYQNVPDGVLVHIFEYDRVSLDSSDNLTSSAYVLTPILNCVSATSCEQCINITSLSAFECGWCNQLSRCSDGIDRYRQDWFTSGCEQEQQTVTCKPPINPTKSSTITPFSTTSSVTNLPQSMPVSSSSALSTSAKAGIGVAVVVLVLVSALLILGLVFFLHAYHTPTSRMGQIIIKYRPKARSLNKNSSSNSYDVSSEKATLEEDL